MSSLLHTLQDLARKARARVPQPIEDAVRAVLRRVDHRRGTTPPAPPESEPAPVVVEQRPNWELRTQAELVDHIIAHYHEGLRRNLPQLVEAARQIERDYADHPDLPILLADELAAFASSLEGHMLKEETVLFPQLRTGARGGQLDMPIHMMERDHDDHADGLDRIRQLTGGLTPPADAPAAWKQLYADLVTLEAELREHIYLENSILFARASGGMRDD